MFLYAWKRGGFKVGVETFASLAEMNFEFDDVHGNVDGCMNGVFIFCSHCREILRLECFYANHHMH